MQRRKVRKAVYCKYCGEKLPDDARFCSSCGNRVDDQSQPDRSRSDDRSQPDRSRSDDYWQPGGKPINGNDRPNGSRADDRVQLRREEIPTRTERRPESRQVKAPEPVKKSRLPLGLIILAAAVLLAVIGGILFLGRSKGTSSFLTGASESDADSLFEKKGLGSYLYFEGENEQCIVDSDGRVVSFGPEYPDFTSVGDNGVLAGMVSTEGQKEQLFIIKDGEKIVVHEKEKDSRSIYFKLCASGEKLVYYIPETGLYSYDTEDETTKVLDEGEDLINYGYIQGMSYHGSVVWLGNSYLSCERIQEGRPFWAAPFASYLAASDDAEHVLFNSSYQTTSGDGETEDVRNSVDFQELSVPRKYDPDSGQFPSSHTIMTSESIYTSILAHNQDYSEILYAYDGDTYYYKDQEKTRLTTGGILIPVKSISPFSMHMTSNWSDTLIYAWHDIDTDTPMTCDIVAAAAGDYYDITHSMKTLKNQLYLHFDDVSGHVSMVWLDGKLNETELIGNITSPTAFSKDGTKVWCIAGREICCTDLSSGTPRVLSLTWDTDLIYHMQAPYPMPVETDEEGDTAYFISDFRLADPEKSDFASNGDLRRIELDRIDSTEVIDTGVILVQYGGNDLVYYLKNYDPTEGAGTLYRYNAQDGSKEQIAANVEDFYAMDGVLFYQIWNEETSQSSIRRLYSGTESELIAENAYIERQITE